MSYRALFSQAAFHLRQSRLGQTLQPLVDTFVRIFTSTQPITITGPIRIINTGQGPAISIINQENSVKLIEGWDQDGHYVSLGIGLGSEGIVANELILRPNFSIDPEIAHQAYTNAGNQGGVQETDPEGFANIYAFPGSGNDPLNTRANALGHGYGTGTSGSGLQYDILGGNETFYVVPPPSGGGGGGGSGSGGGAIYGTIASLGADTITVTLITGGVVTVAKPYHLRRSTFDGETVGGITYSYTGDQTRDATDGVLSEAHEVVPAYAVGEGILVAETPDGNGTGAGYMDVNSDARAWAQITTGC